MHNHTEVFEHKNTTNSVIVVPVKMNISKRLIAVIVYFMRPPRTIYETSLNKRDYCLVIVAY